jgi:hypothetical protein
LAGPTPQIRRYPQLDPPPRGSSGSLADCRCTRGTGRNHPHSVGTTRKTSGIRRHRVPFRAPHTEFKHRNLD